MLSLQSNFHNGAAFVEAWNLLSHPFVLPARDRGPRCAHPSSLSIIILTQSHTDLPSFEKHVLHIAQAGVGPLLAGTNGEAIHLLHDERITLIKAARRALDGNGFADVPLIVGTGAGSTRETVLLCRAAAQAGADYAIVITPGYFSAVLANDREALKAFYREVSQKSPIPIILYNCEYGTASICG